MATIIKTFSTPNGLYVYDRQSNSILSVNKEEYKAFTRLEKRLTTRDDESLLARYKEQGFLQESLLKEIEHPATPSISFQLKKHVKQLTMQVTQSCNLRCSYCAYGGNYDNQRTHSKKTMDLDMMRDCVDFLVEHSRGVDEAVIGFYGGEPFLEIDKIKDCVKYVRETYARKKISFTATTNGTIINDDIINFLAGYDFNLLISIDGPKHLHNMNRVYDSGGGSYDDIMRNVEYIKLTSPNYFPKVSFATTVGTNTDFRCINNFFNATDILRENTTRYNVLNDALQEASATN